MTKTATKPPKSKSLPLGKVGKGKIKSLDGKKIIGQDPPKIVTEALATYAADADAATYAKMVSKKSKDKLEETLTKSKFRGVARHQTEIGTYRAGIVQKKSEGIEISFERLTGD